MKIGIKIIDIHNEDLFTRGLTEYFIRSLYFKKNFKMLRTASLIILWNMSLCRGLIKISCKRRRWLTIIKNNCKISHKEKDFFFAINS